jgi:peptidoglycan/xylan/chitin deacetylase (PgdA/CDA1 family)
MLRTSVWGFTVDDIGMDVYSTEEHLANILSFLNEYKIKATFFAVPEVDGRKLNARSGYVALLRDAIQMGHEVAQHGLRHDRFEIGIPPVMILNLPHEGPARRFLAENRENLHKEHTVDRIREKLNAGRKIIEDAIGMEVYGFRSPALQTCDNMFIALAEEGYMYDSSLYLQKAGWDILNGLQYVPQKIDREKFTQLQRDGLLELPLTTEYTWYLERNNFDKSYDLATHDFNSCMEEDIPFVNLCHVSPIQEGSDGNLGFAFYRKLFDYARTTAARDRCELKAATLFEIASAFRV